MTARGHTTLTAAVCLVVSLAASVFLLRHIDEIRPQATLDDVLYVSSPKMVKRASLGFDGLMACVYWTRTVQYFGHRHYIGAGSYNELAPLLEITTVLDPHLLPAYQFGASFLAPKPPNGAGEPARAIRLMEYGIEHNPDQWQLYYNLGFVYYTELKDYRDAAEVFERGSNVPHAHPFMKILAAQMAAHSGDFSTARMLWSTTFETAYEANIRQNAFEHLRAIQVDEDVTQLEALVANFTKRTGHLPSSISELAAAEHLRGVPVDPDGDAYQLAAEGRVVVQTPNDFPFITKGMRPGFKPGPPRFHSQR